MDTVPIRKFGQNPRRSLRKLVLALRRLKENYTTYDCINCCPKETGALTDCTAKSMIETLADRIDAIDANLAALAAHLEKRMIEIDRKLALLAAQARDPRTH